MLHNPRSPQALLVQRMASSDKAQEAVTEVDLVDQDNPSVEFEAGSLGLATT